MKSAWLIHCATCSDSHGVRTLQRLLLARFTQIQGAQRDGKPTIRWDILGTCHKRLLTLSTKNWLLLKQNTFATRSTSWRLTSRRNSLLTSREQQSWKLFQSEMGCIAFSQIRKKHNVLTHHVVSSIAIAWHKWIRLAMFFLNQLIM